MEVGSFTSGGHCLRGVLIYESGGGDGGKTGGTLYMSGCLKAGTEKEQQQHSEGCEYKPQGLLLPVRVYQ